MCVVLTPTSINTLGEISSSRSVLHNNKICNKGSMFKYTHMKLLKRKIQHVYDREIVLMLIT